MEEEKDQSQDAEELLQLFNLSLQMLCVAGTDGYFKRVNPAFERALGYSPAELTSRSFLDFIHPEDRERTLAEVGKLARGIPTIEFENRYRRKDGVYRWLSWSAAPVRERSLIYAAALDVTERKRAETLFRELLESAPDSMIIANRPGKIVLINRLAEKTFGYSRDEIIGRDLEILIPERFRAAHREYFLRYMMAPHARAMGAGREIWGLRKDGTEFPAEISLSPLETEDGLLILSAQRDITERKLMEQALLRKESQLWAAQQIQARLLPEASPFVEGFDLFGACYPAEFTAGDHFDYLPMTRDRIGIVVSDVAGHGLGPALVMASTHAHLRSLTEICPEPDEILSRLNDHLVRETEPNIFVTLLFTCLDPRTRTLRYASAGHMPGCVLDPHGGRKAMLHSTSLPLGIEPGTRYPFSAPMALAPGDVLLLFTDGLVEAASPDDTPFGIDRLATVAGPLVEKSAREIGESILRDLKTYTGGHQLADDVTLVVVKASPEN